MLCSPRACKVLSRSNALFPVLGAAVPACWHQSVVPWTGGSIPTPPG